MSNVALLLDNYKKACSIASDNALALDLGVTRQVVSQWRAGTSYPSGERIAHIAKAADPDPGVWLVAIHAERAEGEERKAWNTLTSRLKLAGLYIMSTVKTVLSRPKIEHRPPH